MTASKAATKAKKRPVGRPTIFTPEVITRLEEAFAYGATDLEACAYANVSVQALYKYQERQPEFVERKAKLKELPVFTARKSVIDRLSRDPHLSLKFLERKKKDEFSLRSELTGKDGEAIEVRPVEVMNVAPAKEGQRAGIAKAKSDS